MLVIGPCDSHQFLRGRRPVPFMPAKAIDFHVDPAKFGHDVRALRQLRDGLTPLPPARGQASGHWSPWETLPLQRIAQDVHGREGNAARQSGCRTGVNLSQVELTYHVQFPMDQSCEPKTRLRLCAGTYILWIMRTPANGAGSWARSLSGSWMRSFDNALIIATPLR